MSKMHNVKTESDLLFETYLDQRGIAWDYEPDIADKTTRIHYRITRQNGHFFFEVKGFPGIYPVSSSQSSIRGKINEAQKQLKQYREYPCSLVLASPKGAVHLGPDFVLGAMLGDIGVVWNVPRDP